MRSNLATVGSPAHSSECESADALRVFSTCPSFCPSLLTASVHHYRQRVSAVARWSEHAKCTGILIGSDSTSMVDSWLVSQIVIENTRLLCPLVAVQPAHMHPYVVAKMVSTLGLLYHRRVFLNMLSGISKNEVAGASDPADEECRRLRLVEYTQIVQGLLSSSSPLTFTGQIYQTRSLSLGPPLTSELRPGVLISGTSEAGLAAARETHAIALHYPEPASSPNAALPPKEGPCGIRIGIIARPRSDAAWRVALNRFPEDRMRQLAHRTVAKDSAAPRRHMPSTTETGPAEERGPFWPDPFDTYQTTCPYLVGNYQEVAAELTSYMDLGYRTCILDIPATEAEFEHTGTVMQAVWQRGHA